MILHIVESLKEKKPEDAKPRMEKVVSSYIIFLDQTFLQIDGCMKNESI